MSDVNDEGTISEEDDLTAEERAKLAGSVQTYATRLGQPSTPIPLTFLEGRQSTKMTATPDEARAFFGPLPDPEGSERSQGTNKGNVPSRPLTNEEKIALADAKRVVKEELASMTNATPVTIPPTPSRAPFDASVFGAFPPVKVEIPEAFRRPVPPTGSLGIHLTKPINLGPAEWNSPESPLLTSARRLESTGDPAFAGLTVTVQSILVAYPGLTPDDPSANQLIGERLHQRRVIEDVARQLQTSPDALTAEEFIDVVEAEKRRFPLIAVELPDFAKFRGQPDFKLWFEEWKLELGFKITFRPPPPIAIDFIVDHAFFESWHKRLDELKPAPKQPREIWEVVRATARLTATILEITEVSLELFIDLVKEIQAERKKAFKHE